MDELVEMVNVETAEPPGGTLTVAGDKVAAGPFATDGNMLGDIETVPLKLFLLETEILADVALP